MSSRTLTVSGPAIPLFLGQPALEPVRLSGHEGMNSLFEYELLLKTPDALNLGASEAADFDLDAFIGREISCSIELDGAGSFVAGAVGASVDAIGAGTRQINAIVTRATFLGEEGRHLQYRLILAPWLWHATRNSNCHPFQNQTVVDILDELLGAYAFPVDKRLLETYPPRDIQIQYNESDFAFFSRLCQEWGISYHFEHTEGKHRLVLTDSMGAYLQNPSEAYQSVDYHPPGWKTDAEYLHAFIPVSALTAGAYATRDYDHTRPKADLSVSRRDPRPTGLADAEVYAWHADAGGAHYAQPKAGTAAPEANDSAAEARFIATLRMQALRTAGNRSTAKGNLRGMVPGCTFRLQAHPRQRANTEYLILDTRFLIENVAPDSQIKDAAPGRRQQWRIDVELTAHPLTEPLRPALTQPKPRIGTQSALVVGPDGGSSPDGKAQNIWTDRLGRIKVHFLWDRKSKKDQNSSCWIRVGGSWSGNQLGVMHLPRVGQEVLVDFIGDDPDLPICTGGVHNGMNEPPWELPGQAALSGIRSRELTPEGGNSAAGRSNHLLMDDTAGQIQVQLKSDHLSSSLSLGHNTRVDGHAGRKDARGEGFELRSDGPGVLRADGLIISAESHPNAQGHAKDIHETLGRLKDGHEQHESLSDSARQAQAQVPGDQDDVAQALGAQNASLQGKDQSQGDAEDKSFPELADPHLLLTSPAGIQTDTAGSTHIASTEHNALTSGGHTSVSAGKSLLVSVKQSIKLFAFNAGMKFTAYMGDIDLRALKNSIHMMAALDITVVGTEIVIRAKERLTLMGKTSSIVLDGNITDRTPGRRVVHAAGHSATGPESLPNIHVEPGSVIPPRDHEEKLKVVDFLGNELVPDGKAALRQANSNTAAQIAKGELDLNAVAKRLIRPWSEER